MSTSPPVGILPRLALFAAAIRGAPVSLTLSTATSATTTCALTHARALESALSTSAVPLTFELAAEELDETPARLLRTLGWPRTGSTASVLEPVLALAPQHMSRLLAACEAIRTDAALARMYPGARAGFARLDTHERKALAAGLADAAPGLATIETALARLRLGLPQLSDILPAGLRQALAALALPDARASDSARCALACWRLAESATTPAVACHASHAAIEAPESGPMPPSRPSATPGQSRRTAGSGSEDPGDDDPSATTDAAVTDGTPGAGDGRQATDRLRPHAGAASREAAEGIRVDEWNYLDRRILRRWCRIVPARPPARSGDYRSELMRRERTQLRLLRRHLARWQAAGARRRRLCEDGEEIDIDELVRTIARRRAGAVGQQARMIRREPAHRDIAVAVLLDVSASTDFVLRDPQATPAVIEPDPEEDDPFLWSPGIFEPAPDADAAPVRRVIDVARDAVGLLAQAFDWLGDCCALYAFSGSGREQVDFLTIKDYDETMSTRCWQVLAALEPMRSTRMGAAIRHASASLRRRPQARRVLIVISDGYPDDIDYGPDRRNIEYGLRDTAHAIAQARSERIDTLLITIDRAGHDYLRRMCQPGRYRVIEEVDTLARETAAAYLLLTR